jgi:outer membrane lipoprotein SlyB
MKSLLALSLAAACATASLSVPQFAAAQRYDDTRDYGYGDGDLCAQQRKDSTTKGTLAGAGLGALAGAALAGKGAKTEGAVLGGVVGGVVGHQVGKHNVKCASYPRRISQNNYSRNNCRWVEEYYDGRNHSLEVCRDRDGVWRPSGRR